jgi:hypothetical protein
MVRHRVAINDLGALSISMPDSLSLGPGNPHYTAEGYARMAQQVAENIQRVLKSK